MSTLSLDPVSQLQSTLGTPYRIKITDGRLFTGNFVALDKQGNLVLDQGLEHVPQAGEEGYTVGRDMGLILLQKRHWVSVEREVDGPNGHKSGNGKAKGEEDEAQQGDGCRTA